MNSARDVIFLSIIGSVSGFVIGVLIGNSYGERCSKKQMQEEAIKQNAAHYDPKTGKFVWNDEVKE